VTCGPHRLVLLASSFLLGLEPRLAPSPGTLPHPHERLHGADPSSGLVFFPTSSHHQDPASAFASPPRALHRLPRIGPLQPHDLTEPASIPSCIALAPSASSTLRFDAAAVPPPPKLLHCRR